MFADDSSIGVSARSPEELEQKVMLATDQYQSWCDKNNLISNLNKAIRVNLNIKRCHFPVAINVTDIKSESSTKFLGLYIDYRLNWNFHIDHVSKKLNSTYYALLQLRSEVDIKTLMNVYYSLAYFYMTYNVIFWGNTLNINRTFVAQKILIR